MGAEEPEVETIDIDHSFSQTRGGAGTAQSTPRTASMTGSVFGSVVPSPSSVIGPNSPPATIVNPWSRPSSLFTRNFQSESADAELFVQLSRDRTKAELHAAGHRKGKSSIIMAHTASVTQDRPPAIDDDEPEHEEADAHIATRTKSKVQRQHDDEEDDE